MREIEIRSVTGAAIGPWIDHLAALRIEVFRDFPYLYDGDADYEREYLSTYLRSDQALIVLALDGEQVVGASTGLPLLAETDNLIEPFVRAGLAPEQVFYFGESVLLPDWRGQGLGHRFFDEREAHARAAGFRYTAFCAVDRSPDDPRRPPGHRFLDEFWRRRGYSPQPAMQAAIAWKEIGESSPSEKRLTFWLRDWQAGAEGIGTTELIDEQNEQEEQAGSTQVMTEAASPTARPGRRPATDPAPDLTSGAILRERFQVEDKLGEGGMGTVYSAVDLLKREAMDKDERIALKVMRPGIVDADLSFMGLQREARRAQQLAHPNIVTVYDFDRADGVIYMTMEYLDGQPLDALLARNCSGLESDQARDITTQICHGLAHAHGEGIVHADLKPENVFVLSSGRAKILDFGIAQAYQAARRDVVEKFFTGFSPGYASPQVMERQPPRPTDDIYALGCIVYQLFAGRHPFDGATALEARECRQRPVRPAGLKRAEWRAIRRALDFDHRRRPADAEGFLKTFAPSRVRQAAAAVSLASVAAAAAFILLYQPEPGPDIPFAELPEATRSHIAASLEDAEDFLEFGDINGALQLFHSVLSIHPGNPDAVAGMNRATGQALTQIDRALAEGALRSSDARRAIETLLDYEHLPGESRRRAQRSLDRMTGP